MVRGTVCSLALTAERIGCIDVMAILNFINMGDRRDRSKVQPRYRSIFTLSRWRLSNKHIDAYTLTLYDLSETSMLLTFDRVVTSTLFRRRTNICVKEDKPFVLVFLLRLLRCEMCLSQNSAK